MRTFILAAATLVASSIAIPAHALIFFSNYTPSQTSFTQTGGSYPVKRRAPDATQSFDSFAVSREFQFGVICCTFRNESVVTQFVAPDNFTAHAIVVPLQHISSVGNRNMALTIQRLDGSNWVNARNESWAIIPSQTTGVITEIEARFGSNSTSRPQDFAARPVPFIAGQTYRIVTSNAAGGIGRVQWYLSDEAAAAGQSLQRYSYKAATSLAFQPAFALTDGGDLTFPVVVPPPPPPFPESSVPEPASWAMLITGFGLVGGIARRRRARLQTGQG
jgi:hypothetical protein